eukprot:TRINITY_DN11631_c0_g1_i1.p1 TRINITY_DN11631_c0_g1~~TRINITY_DN11631_c0_g1_i1.p1  ORF type:complete len:502 (-),score=55.66 TRINITY_DN11631_c0_g1_i1:1143-2543(-)
MADHGGDTGDHDPSNLLHLLLQILSISIPAYECNSDVAAFVNELLRLVYHYRLRLHDIMQSRLIHIPAQVPVASLMLNSQRFNQQGLSLTAFVDIECASTDHKRKYPDSQRKQEIADQFHCEFSTVVNLFNNHRHRTRIKKARTGAIHPPNVAVATTAPAAAAPPSQPEEPDRAHDDLLRNDQDRILAPGRRTAFVQPTRAPRKRQRDEPQPQAVPLDDDCAVSFESFLAAAQENAENNARMNAESSDAAPSADVVMVAGVRAPSDLFADLLQPELWEDEPTIPLSPPSTSSTTPSLMQQMPGLSMGYLPLTSLSQPSPQTTGGCTAPCCTLQHVAGFTLRTAEQSAGRLRSGTEQLPILPTPQPAVNAMPRVDRCAVESPLPGRVGTPTTAPSRAVLNPLGDTMFLTPLPEPPATIAQQLNAFRVVHEQQPSLGVHMQNVYVNKDTKIKGVLSMLDKLNNPQPPK